RLSAWCRPSACGPSPIAASGPPRGPRAWASCGPWWPAPGSSAAAWGSTDVLRLNNGAVIYSDVMLVLTGLCLTVPEGQVVALLGANGAGKTTTLRAISGLLRAEEGRVADGTIELEGTRIEGRDPEAIVRMGIFQVMEGRRVFEGLTVEEELPVGACTRRDRDAVRRDHADRDPYRPPPTRR